MKEIERRFALDRTPPIPPDSTRELWQGYLVVEPAATVRVRSIDSVEFWLGVKTLPDPASALVRDETEVLLSSEQFSILREAVVHRPILKTRTRFNIGGLTVEVDDFHGHLEGLLIAEVEFTSVASSERFVVPSWFGGELTEDRRFLNSELAKVAAAPT